MGRLSTEEEEGEERKLLTEGNQASQDGNTRPSCVLVKITQNLKQQPHENSSGSSGPSKIDHSLVPALSLLTTPPEGTGKGTVFPGSLEFLTFPRPTYNNHQHQSLFHGWGEGSPYEQVPFQVPHLLDQSL